MTTTAEMADEHVAEVKQAMQTSLSSGGTLFPRPKKRGIGNGRRQAKQPRTEPAALEDQATAEATDAKKAANAILKSCVTLNDDINKTLRDLPILSAKLKDKRYPDAAALRHSSSHALGGTRCVRGNYATARGFATHSKRAGRKRF